MSLSLRSRAAVGALKASYIVCNLAAYLPESVGDIVKLSPLLIAHVGLTYGPALCLQCAWALGNMAAATPAAAAVLLAQGAIPTLLDILTAAARSPADAALAAAGATCAWALSNIVRGTGTPKAANVLLSCCDPRLDAAAQRVLLSRQADADLLLEAAWLLAHTLRSAAPGTLGLACREPIAHSMMAALAAAAAAIGPDAAACLAASQARWRSAPPVCATSDAAADDEAQHAMECAQPLAQSEATESNGADHGCAVTTTATAAGVADQVCSAVAAAAMLC